MSVAASKILSNKLKAIVYESDPSCSSSSTSPVGDIFLGNENGSQKLANCSSVLDNVYGGETEQDPNDFGPRRLSLIPAPNAHTWHSVSPDAQSLPKDICIRSRARSQSPISGDRSHHSVIPDVQSLTASSCDSLRQLPNPDAQSQRLPSENSVRSRAQSQTPNTGNISHHSVSPDVQSLTASSYNSSRQSVYSDVQSQRLPSENNVRLRAQSQTPISGDRLHHSVSPDVLSGNSTIRRHGVSLPAFRRPAFRRHGASPTRRFAAWRFPARRFADTAFR